jgi:hypothetical protein
MTPAKRAIYHYVYWFKQKRKSLHKWDKDDMDFCQYQMSKSRQELINQLLTK